MRSHVVAWLSEWMPHGVAAAIAPSWFTCVGLAGLVGLLLMLRGARRRGIDTGVVASVVLWCYLAAVAAGIVVPMTIDAVEQLLSTGHVRVRWAGMTSFWGYLAGGIAVAIVCRRNQLSLARLGDLAAVPMGVALVFARLGCFLGGCDYGKVTGVPWAVRFPSGSAAWRDHLKSGLLPPERAESLPVHPTQLYEALLGLVIVVVAVWASRQKWRDGRVFLAAAATYALGRIVVEVFRGDLGRGIYAGLSSGQIFSLCVLAAIGLGLCASRKRIVAIAAVSSVALALWSPHEAHAQPYAPPHPSPAPEPQPQPPPYQPPYQPPYVEPQPQPPQMQQPPPPPPQQAPVVIAPMPPRERIKIHVSLTALGGLAIPLNRRQEQVPALAGPSVSIGLTGESLGFWVDLDSLGNRDASHGTLLFSAGFIAPAPNGKLRVGARLGLGPTLVNFDEPAFRDVTGTTVRFDGIADYALTRNWRVDLRPLSLDVLMAADLGGPILTWQTRLGVTYAFSTARYQ